MQGLDLQCHRVDGETVYGWANLQKAGSLEGCAAFASTQGLNSFTYELTSGDCYPRNCDTVYQEYTDDSWSSPPGNFLLFTR
eukprot:Awhi_evm1s5839